MAEVSPVAAVAEEVAVVGRRLIFGSIGMIAAIVAVIGVWLPGVPTTMPLLVALWAFGKSNPKLQRRLEKLPLLRHALAEAHRFEKEKSVSRQVKLISQACAWISAIVVGLITQSVVITSILVVLALVCTGFMLYIPTRSKRTTITQNEVVVRD